MEDAADRIAERCLAVRLRMVHRVVTGYYDQALAPLGLTVGQLNVLTLLASRGPMPPGEVARLLEIDPSTMTRNVSRMVARGLLVRGPGGPGRSYRLEVTAPGQEILEKAEGPWQVAQERTLTLLGEEGANALFSTARRIWAG